MTSKMKCVVALVFALPALSAGVAFAADSDAQADGPPGSGVEDEDCSRLPQGSERVSLERDDFVASIDNPYFPLAPGSEWIYRETDAEGNEQRVVVTVTDRQKKILGISATVVRDTVTEDGELVEDTWDWYAQDECGNVWYLGEDTKEYENGEVVSTAGSWQAGVDRAQAGIIMPGDPEVGLAYRQEYYAGEAEDAAEILSLDERVKVPYGSFRGVLQTKDFTPLDPELLEHKFYAKGVGNVLVVDVAGGGGRQELLSFVKGGS